MINNCYNNLLLITINVGNKVNTEDANLDAENNSNIGPQVEDFLRAWFAVRQQVQGLNFNRAHQHGMSTTQFMVLRFMEEATSEEPCTISWLAGRLNLDPATIVRTVDSLEKRGLVVRRRDTRDRRQVFVDFTATGRNTQQSSERMFKYRVTEVFSAMSAEGRSALVRGLEEFVAVSEQGASAAE